MIGQTLGHFRIIEKIGAGGMGVVYRAHDEQLNRDVAIKVLPAGALADDTARKRFRQEALALSRLNHPNIGTVHEFGSQGTLNYLVMEYVAGMTLSEKLGGRPLPEKEIVPLGVQLAEGLATAHGHGLVHRDLKPNNLRVTPDGRLKILDFGLAKRLAPSAGGAATASEPLTEPHAAPGTLPYMAPEQLSGEAPDTRSDLYAAGAILYEMATGQRVFTRESQPVRLVRAILYENPRAPSSSNPHVSPGLENIILKCLEKDPEHRYQSAKELLADLRRLGAGATVVAVPSRFEAFRPWWLGILGLGIALAIAFVLLPGDWRERLTGSRGARIRSVAVLPLLNLSGDPEQDYFADGMTDAVIMDLGQVGALRVISRTSVMQYKGTKKTVPTIASELSVDAVVEGSVLRSGDRARISALLIQANPERELWGESYEGSLQDLLKLQNEVARAVAREIEIKLTPQEQAELGRTRTVNPRAHDAYLRGRYLWNKRTEDSLKKSVEFFQQAVAEDPQYAAAYSGLADSYHLLPVYSNIAPKDTHERAKAAALKAVQIDPALAEAHTSLAAIAADDDWDFEGAEREFRKAIALNPNYATAHQWYAETLTYTGRFDEAVMEIQKALDLDPLSLIIGATAGEILIRAGKYDQAIVQLHKTIDLEKDFPFAHQALKTAYEYKHMFLQAIAEDAAAAVAEGEPAEQAGRGASILRAAFLQHGEGGYWRARIVRAEQNIRKGKVVGYDESPVKIASFHAHLGDTDSAVQWLQKALEQRSIGLAYVRTSPEFQALKSDPRVVKIMRLAGFPP